MEKDTPSACHGLKTILQDWPRMEEYLSGSYEEKIGQKKRDSFVKIIQRLSKKGNSYLESIGLLTPAQTKEGTDWLRSVIKNIIAECINNDTRSSRRKEK